MKAKEIIRRGRRLKWLAILLPALFIIPLTGCQSVPAAAPELRQQALSFNPPPGMAGLYVIRPHHIAGAAVNWAVRLDYQDFGSVETKSYLYSAILPGKHFIRQGAADSGFHVKTFVAEAGKNYYFTMRPSINPFDEISEVDGQKLARQFKMSGANSYKSPFNP